MSNLSYANSLNGQPAATARVLGMPSRQVSAGMRAWAIGDAMATCHAFTTKHESRPEESSS